MLFLFLLRKIISMPSAKTLSAVLALITMFLMVFLALACHRADSTFSEIYLIEAATNNGQSVLRAGYFRMCETAGTLNGTHSAHFYGNTTSKINCQNLGNFHGTDLAYTFAKHVARPYFIVVTATLSAISMFGAFASWFYIGRPAIAQFAFLITVTTLGFAVITACWQQVAVQAAVRLIPTQVKRGRRAGGMVWSGVALLILSATCQGYTAISERRLLQSQREAEYANSMATQSCSDVSYISRPVNLEKQ